MKYRFLEQLVIISSGIEREVIGRTEFLDPESECQYYVRELPSKRGRKKVNLLESWFPESELERLNDYD